MSAIAQTVQFRCDWCQKASDQVIPLPESGYLNETRPDGWAGIGYGTVSVDPYFRVRLADYQGAEIRHLCPDCSRRPAGELLEHLARIGQEATA